MSTPSELLQAALNEYRKAEANLIANRSKAETAQRQAEASIGDFEQSEGAASNRLMFWQVMVARVKAREQELSKSLGELGQTVTTTSQQLNSAVMELWIKRRAVLGKRAIEAMQVPERLLEQGVLDEAFGFSAPLLAVKEFGVPVYSPRFTETITQLPVQMVTVNVGDGVNEPIREILETVTTDRQPRVSQCIDVEYLLQCAEQILKNFDGLAKESERTI